MNDNYESVLYPEMYYFVKQSCYSYFVKSPLLCKIHLNIVFSQYYVPVACQ